MHSRTARGRIAGLILVVAGLIGAAQASAAVSPTPIVRPFTVRYAINTNGDIAMASNTLLTCKTGEIETQSRVGCADVQNGGAGDRQLLQHAVRGRRRQRRDLRLLQREPEHPGRGDRALRRPLLGRRARPGRDAAAAVRPGPAAHGNCGRQPARGGLGLAAGPSHAWVRPDQRERLRHLHRGPGLRVARRRRAHALPGLRRRDRARAARRRRHLHGRQRPGRHGRRPPCRLVARGRLPGRHAARAQPDDLRRLRTGRAQRQRAHDGQRLQDAADGRRSTRKSGSSPTRATAPSPAMA